MAEKRPIKVSPRGIAAYTKWLYEKDTKFAKGDPKKEKYIATIVIPKADKAAKKFIKNIQDSHFELDGTKKNCPVKDGDKRTKTDPEDNDKKIPDEQFEGMWLVQFKSQHKPTCVDGTGAKLPPNVKVFPGDEVRIAYQENPIEDGAVTGFFMYLGSVQLLKKNSDGGGIGEAAANAFGAVEDAYDASADAAAKAAEGEDHAERNPPPADGDY
jgi:hypothetical protein